MYTITISNLDFSEASHIADILNDYTESLKAAKINAIVEDLADDGYREEWFDAHIAWHKSILEKAQYIRIPEDDNGKT